MVLRGGIIKLGRPVSPGDVRYSLTDHHLGKHLQIIPDKLGPKERVLGDLPIVCKLHSKRTVNSFASGSSPGRNR